jgi:hypothetical protein
VGKRSIMEVIVYGKARSLLVTARPVTPVTRVVNTDRYIVYGIDPP